MKYALATLPLLFAAPAFAQAVQPDQRPPKAVDWTRPVTGIDSPVLPAAATAEQVTQRLTVFAQGQTAPGALHDTPLPPPCEPPVTKTQTAKPPPPPCPQPPR